MKKIYKSLTVSAIVATVSLSALPQSLAITHESQPTKQQRTVSFDCSHGQTAGAADWVSDGAFSDYAKFKNKVMTLKLFMVIRT